MTAELVVFDWDGTLIDSTGRIADCLQLAAQECGLPILPRTNYLGIIGLGLPEALRSATIAIASTGTVTMECALFRVPTVALSQLTVGTVGRETRDSWTNLRMSPSSSMPPTTPAIPKLM